MFIVETYVGITCINNEGGSAKGGHVPLEIFSSLKNVMVHLRHVNKWTAEFRSSRHSQIIFLEQFNCGPKFYLILTKGSPYFSNGTRSLLLLTPSI